MLRTALMMIFLIGCAACYSQPANDNFASAIDVTGLIGGCSTDAAFTTNLATPDLNAGSCWNNMGPQLNVWFSFVAPSSSISITVDRGGAKGSQQRSMASILDSDGVTEIACKRYQLNGEDIVVEALNALTIGNTYYISVDTYSSSYRGTFSLCLSEMVSYDFYEGAIDVTSLIGTCSSDQAYSTIGGTSDGGIGSCWDNSWPQFNRWFYFVASTSNMSITVDRGGTKGSQQRSQVTLWETDGTTELDCSKYQSNGEDVVIDALGALTPGDTYYISVDTYSDSYDGTFTLCLEDEVSYDYFEGAIDVTSLINSCSSDQAYSTLGGTPDKNAGSCWDNSGPRFNKWFSFVAPSESMSVSVDIGGVKGSQQRTQIAIWESNGITEVVCKRYQLNGEDVIIEASDLLTPGNTYYISVDTYNASFDGSFTLCLSDGFSYDYFGGAFEIEDTDDWCSLDAEFSTIGGTADLDAGSCWDNSGPMFNRWFSFEAVTSSVSIMVDIGDSKGSQQRSQLTLWESDGTTEVACAKYETNGDDLVIDILGSLTIGNTYYISVDTYSDSYDGSFTLCVDERVSYDYYEGAYLIDDTNNWCSSDAEYSTVGATSDQDAGSCWNSATSMFNRWFSFTAATSSISVMVDIGNEKGTHQRTEVTLWAADGTTEIACRHFQSNTEDVLLEVINSLTIGETYYISVDTDNSASAGTFTLCVDDEVSYDFYEGAIKITDLNNWCSSDAEFSTIAATPDNSSGSCRDNSGPQLNRWFTFTAIDDDISITVDIDGVKGSQLRTQLALWESNGTAEVACANYAADGDDVSIMYSGLTIGNDYYISVDTYDENYHGTFTLCVSNVGQPYYSIGDGEWDNPNIWSTAGHAGGSSSFYPQAGDLAYIRGNSVSVTTNQNVAQVDVDIESANTTLTINGASLIVTGQFNFTNSGHDFDGEVLVINGGELGVQDDLSLNRNGGANAFNLAASGSSSIDVGQNFTINSTAGSVNNNLITLENSSEMIVEGETTLRTLAGIKTQLIVNNDASFVGVGNINLIASGIDLVEVEINDDATLNLESSIIRGTPAYGILDCNNNALIGFTSDENTQAWPESVGESTDGFNYVNVLINNSKIATPQIILAGDVGLSGTLILSDGIVEGSLDAVLTLEEGASLIGGSNNSFIDGPLRNIGNESFEFPVGDEGIWAPIEVFGLVGGDVSTTITAEYLHEKLGPTTLETPDMSGEDLDHISILEYWDLDVSGSLTSAHVTLHWKDASRSEITDYDDLRIAHYDNGDSEWENYGIDAITNADPGSITVNDVANFSPFTFGTTNNSNSLPVELAYFNGKLENNEVTLKWATYSETNNDRFEIERSLDGRLFKPVGRVKGNGTKNAYNQYQMSYPSNGDLEEFYKLIQIDFDGTKEVLGIVLVSNQNDRFQRPIVYPNPLVVGNDINIELNQQYSETLIEVYNMTGKLLSHFPIKKQEDIKIQVNLKSGVYLLQISTPKGLTEHALIVK